MATLQVAGGYTAAVTGRALTISGITSCAASFGSGCMVAAGGIVLSGWAADQVAAGLMTISGHPTGTFGAQALVSVFGMSPGAAELLYGMAGGAAASAAGSARQIPGTVIVKDGEMTVVGQPGVQVKGYGGQTALTEVGVTRVGDGPLPTGYQTLDPTEISFSQATVSGQMSNGMSFDEFVAVLRRDGWKGDPVDVVNMPDGVPTSMDNRRLLAARQAGIPIPAHVRNASDLLTPEEVQRFKVKGEAPPTTWGEAIQLRVQRQRGISGADPSWSDRFPNWSIYDPKINGGK
ncbi:hypothetical protein [Granulibacter bethesdensis]|uniref:hypothetical protein n=1 Tax=Granulibacter bethesdensis TaxID=364410 RepID=UPI001E57A78A|nr:hypothetical protein [Granulibacter bethesdensis]